MRCTLQFAALTNRLGVAVALVLTGCGDGTHPPSTIVKIGALHDRSGPAIEPTRLDAFNFGISHVNAGLALAKYKNLELETVVRDSANQQALAVQGARELLDVEGVKLIALDNAEPVVGVNKTFYDADPTNDVNVP